MCCQVVFLFFFKQKTAYEMRISDWSSDVCSSDLLTLCLSVGAHPVSDSALTINAKSGQPHRAPAGGVHRFRGIAPCTRTASRSGTRPAHPLWHGTRCTRKIGRAHV